MELPPKEELENRRYHYDCPYPPGPPPMDYREFLHYYYNHSRGHPENIYLERLPKKLGNPLNKPPLVGPAYGWGIHIIEGPDKVLLTWCCFGILVISFLVSVIYAIVMDTQEQGFGIGQWIVSVLTAALAALYFQWEQA